MTIFIPTWSDNKLISDSLAPFGSTTQTSMIRLADTGGGTPLYQLKITLRGSKPPIWRRVVVRSDMKLDRLHSVILVSMGWLGGHLHQFRVGRVYYGIPDPEFDDLGGQTLNEKKYAVADLAPAARKRFSYEYDMGDSWQHEVLLEKVLPPDPDLKHPICLGGANACPPEDCGGVYGYARFLEAMADPKHPEHEQMEEWIGGGWDATRFNVEDANAGLKKIKA